MEAVTHAARVTGSPLRDDIATDLSFLPGTLTGQCRSLIESYHDVHGRSEEHTSELQSQ